MTAVESPQVARPQGPSSAAARRMLAPPLLAGLVAVLGLDAWIVGCLLHNAGSPDTGFSSLIGALFPLWHIETWFAFPYSVFALGVLAVLALATRPALRAGCAGALVGLGVEAYLMSAPVLVIWLADGAHGVAAWAFLTVGAALTACGGALLHSRAESRRRALAGHRTGLPLAAAVVALVGAVALLVSTILPVYPDATGGATSALGLSGASRWLALEPAGLGLAGLTLVAMAAGGLDRAAAGGALAGLGTLAVASQLSLAEQVGFGDSSVHVGTWVALSAAAALCGAGGAALVLAGRGRALPSYVPREKRVALEPTRHLAAAAQLDVGFARRAVRDVLHERHRAVAPAAGLELGTVLRHCAAARGRVNARDLLLALLVLPLLAALFHPSHGALVLLGIVVLSWLAIGTELWIGRYRVAARHLSPGADCAVPEYLPPGAEARVRGIEASESTNLVVYSGYSPYVGNGQIAGGWSFAINVRKGKEDLAGARRTPRPFTEAELHDHVADRLRSIDLPSLTLADRLYVDGEHVRDDPRFLPDRHGRPRRELTQVELESADAAGPPDVVRRLRSASVSGWGAELVYTMFLDFVQEGASLFADATYCLLTPPDQWYRQVDSIDPRPSFGERLHVVGEALMRTIKLPIVALKSVPEVRAAGRAWRRRIGERRQIALNPRFDYGATTSLRELAQSRFYRRHFQSVDRDMFAKVLEHAALDAILEFLAEHDIDTTELEERQAAVLNNGVIVTGGAVSAQSLAVGASARSTVVRAAQRAAAKAAGGAR